MIKRIIYGMGVWRYEIFKRILYLFVEYDYEK